MNERLNPTYWGAVRRIAWADKRPRAALTNALAITVGLFWFNSVYHPELSNYIKLVKWGALILTLIIGVHTLAKQRSQELGHGHILLLIMVGVFAISIPGSIYPLRSLAYWASVVSVLIAAWLLRRCYLTNLAGQRQFFQIFAWYGRGIICVSFVMWVLGINLGRASDASRITTWTDNPNTLGILLAPTVVILLANILARNKSWKLDVVLAIMGVLLIRATGSRDALLWITVSICSFWIARRGFGAGVIAVLVVLVVGIGFRQELVSLVLSLSERTHEFNAFNPNRELLSGRSEVWDYGKSLFYDRPVFGYGLGSSELLINMQDWITTQYNGSHFHNSYLEMLVDTGCVGLLMFVFMVAPAVMKGFSPRGVARSVGSADWPLVALPWALVMGALAHGYFETWILAAGNQDALLFWCCVWILRKS